MLCHLLSTVPEYVVAFKLLLVKERVIDTPAPPWDVLFLQLLHLLPLTPLSLPPQLPFSIRFCPFSREIMPSFICTLSVYGMREVVVNAVKPCLICFPRPSMYVHYPIHFPTPLFSHFYNIPTFLSATCFREKAILSQRFQA